MDLFTALESLDDDILGYVWVQFNCYEWPDELPESVKPPWWDGHKIVTDKHIHQRKVGYLCPAMEYIEQRIGGDAIDDAWQEMA